MKSRNIILFTSSLLITAALSQAALAQTTTPTTPHPETGSASSPSNKMAKMAMGSAATADANFMKSLAMGGMAEVEAGRLATSKASDKEVKDFAEKMVSDHSKNNDQLKTLAKQKQVELPTTVDADHVAEKAKLEKQSGAEFDAQYMQGQVKDHQETVQLLQHEVDSGQDPAVKAFAQETLLVVQHHLKMAKELQGKVSRATK